MVLVEIYRGTEIIATVKPNSTSSQSKKVMAENQVSLSFELDHMVNFNIGDYTKIYEEYYYLNSMPVVKKLSAFNYEYDLILQAAQNTLSKAKYLFLGDDNSYKQIDFSLTGTADTFIDVMVTNISRIEEGWTKGGVVQSSYKTISFSNEDCLTALQKIADTFGSEFYIEGKTIHLAKQERKTKYIFKYGSDRGLYNITRTQLAQTKIITRLYAFGGSTNIPSSYRNFSQRLLMPNVPAEHLISDLTCFGITILGQKTFIFEWTPPINPDVTSIVINYRVKGTTDWTGSTGSTYGSRILRLPANVYEFYFSSLTADDHYDTPVIEISSSILTPLFSGAINYYIENNTHKYGIIEDAIILEDIYPNRIGKVTSVDATNVYVFKDNTIDFDVNAYLMPGVAAKLTFNSGQLTGYTFEINRFDNTLKEFTILKNKDEKTIDVPSDLLKPAINDEYVLTDIIMPQSYVNEAEKLLFEKAKEYLFTNSEAQFNYTVEADIKYFRAKQIVLNIGDLVTLTDIELQVESEKRIISLTRSLIDEYDFTFELGELPKPSKITQLIRGQSGNALLLQSIRDFINGNRLLSGTNIGNFRIEQGGISIPNLPTGTGTPLYLDTFGNIVRGG